MPWLDTAVISAWVLLIGMILVFIGIIWFFSGDKIKSHRVDDYFFSEAIKNRKDFKYATITPYFVDGYFVTCVFGNDRYILRERELSRISGAKVEDVMGNLCWDLRIPKGSLYSEIVDNNEIIIKMKENNLGN